MLVYFTWPTKRPGGHQSQLTMGQSLYAYSAVTAVIHKTQTQLWKISNGKREKIDNDKPMFQRKKATTTKTK